MDRSRIRRVFALILSLCLLLGCAGCGKQKRSSREIVEEMVADYGSYGDRANRRVRSGSSPR